MIALILSLMGISVEQWRTRIGSFCQKVVFQNHFGHTKTGCNIRLLCVIALLLLIGGVEVNPGPTVAEISKRLDEFIHSYQAERDQLLLSIPTLSSRLDEHIKDISALVINMNTSLVP